MENGTGLKQVKGSLLDEFEASIARQVTVAQKAQELDQAATIPNSRGEQTGAQRVAGVAGAVSSALLGPEHLLARQNRQAEATAQERDIEAKRDNLFAQMANQVEERKSRLRNNVMSVEANAAATKAGIKSNEKIAGLDLEFKKNKLVIDQQMHKDTLKATAIAQEAEHIQEAKMYDIQSLDALAFRNFDKATAIELTTLKNQFATAASEQERVDVLERMQVQHVNALKELNEKSDLTIEERLQEKQIIQWQTEAQQALDISRGKLKSMPTALNPDEYIVWNGTYEGFTQLQGDERAAQLEKLRMFTNGLAPGSPVREQYEGMVDNLANQELQEFHRASLTIEKEQADAALARLQRYETGQNTLSDVVSDMGQTAKSNFLKAFSVPLPLALKSIGAADQGQRVQQIRESANREVDELEAAETEAIRLGFQGLVDELTGDNELNK